MRQNTTAGGVDDGSGLLTRTSQSRPSKLCLCSFIPEHCVVGRFGRSSKLRLPARNFAAPHLQLRTLLTIDFVVCRDPRVGQWYLYFATSPDNLATVKGLQKFSLIIVHILLGFTRLVFISYVLNILNTTKILRNAKVPPCSDQMLVINASQSVCREGR